MADVNQNQGSNDEFDKKAIECSNNALFLASLPYETINDLYDELSNYNLKIAGELKEKTKKYGVTSSIPLVGKAISFVKQKKLSKILKKAQKEGKRVKLEGSRKLESDFDKKMAQEKPNNPKDTAVTFEEIKEAGVKVIDSRDEYLAFKEEIIKNAGEISYDDLAKQAELWSTYYTNNLEYLQKREEIARGNYVQAIIGCLGNVPKKALPGGGVYCLIDNEPFTIRHDHKAEDLTAFYKKYKEIKLAKVPTEEIIAPTQPKKAKEASNDKSKMPEPDPIPDDMNKDDKAPDSIPDPSPEPMPDEEITPNVQAYVDLLKLSGCSEEEAIKMATDPANKSIVDKWDRTRGVTAFEEAKQSGKIPADTTLGQFQYGLAQVDQKNVYGMDVELNYPNLDPSFSQTFDNSDKSKMPEPDPIPDDMSKGDKAPDSIPDPSPEPMPEEKTTSKQTKGIFDGVDEEIAAARGTNNSDDPFTDFEPEDIDYSVDSSAQPTRVMTPEEKAARANLENLPGKDLSGFDVLVHPENEVGPIESADNYPKTQYIYGQGQQQTVSTGGKRR